MSPEDIERKVLLVLSAVLKRDFDVGSNVVREQTGGWDSLKHVEIMFALEDEFGLEFSEQELGGLDSTAAIVKAVSEKYAA